MNALSTRSITVSFGGLRALDDVSLALEGGMVSLLVGPNGAGKSTLLKVLLGLVRPDYGVFEVDGEPVAVNADWKRRIGYLPESVAFSENLSGRQLLNFFASARGVRDGRVDESLERVGLSEAGRRRIRGYSRGMRQRLGLAVATLSRPDLLILDEPTSGLDQEGLSVLWSILEEWRDKGRMVLASSHDLALMERRVDELCVLCEGRVLAHGTTADLRRVANLPHRIWFELAADASAKIDLFSTALGKWGKGRIVEGDGGLWVEVAADSILELVEIQSGFPGVVQGIRVEEPTLDRVYDKLLEVA